MNGIIHFLHHIYTINLRFTLHKSEIKKTTKHHTTILQYLIDTSKHNKNDIGDG